MPTAAIPGVNSLLHALPPADSRRLMATLKPVSLVFGEILYEPGATISNVYFPIDSLVSLLTVVDSRTALEVGMIGHEGMLGIPITMGTRRSPVRALVQGAGTALRGSASAFLKEFEASRPLRDRVYGSAHGLMLQIAQTAACNRFHKIDARLARWLLMTRDRVRSSDFALTHQFLSHMLGTRREGVTQAANQLQQRGLIEYARGKLSILDDAGLEAAACSCYEVVRLPRRGVGKNK